MSISDELKEQALHFDYENPKPVAFYLNCLETMFNKIAPNATEEQRDSFKGMKRNLFLTHIETITLIKNKTEGKINKDKEKVKKWMDEYDAVKLFALEGDGRIATEETLEEAKYKRDKAVKEMENLQFELAAIDDKLIAQEKEYKELVKKTEVENEREIVCHYEEMAALQMELAMKPCH
ncbi:Protein CBG27810 [Caenorhabditis briggsae]|nr:Protein CBG27810 [Caenorhabditis briggsae]CAS00322.1 Protein CBG27810 [Caenorhabditis briggsae]